MRKIRMCRAEIGFRRLGFVLLHDGQNNPGQFIFPPDEVVFYTRVYRLRLDGVFTNWWVKFIYDLRKPEGRRDVGLEMTFTPEQGEAWGKEARRERYLLEMSSGDIPEIVIEQEELSGQYINKG